MTFDAAADREDELMDRFPRYPLCDDAARGVFHPVTGAMFVIFDGDPLPWAVTATPLVPHQIELPLGETS